MLEASNAAQKGFGTLFSGHHPTLSAYTRRRRSRWIRSGHLPLPGFDMAKNGFVDRSRSVFATPGRTKNRLRPKQVCERIPTPRRQQQVYSAAAVALSPHAHGSERVSIFSRPSCAVVGNARHLFGALPKPDGTVERLGA